MENKEMIENLRKILGMLPDTLTEEQKQKVEEIKGGLDKLEKKEKKEEKSMDR